MRRSSRKKERLRNILIENQKNDERRAVVKKLEADEDHRLMQEYSAKLDREAYERDTAFQRRIQALEKFASKYQNEGAGKKDHDMQVFYDNLLLQEVAKKEAADLAEEKRRQQYIKQRDHDIALANAKLLESKQMQIDRQRLEDRQFGEHSRQEALVKKRLDDQAKREEFQKRLKYREMLDHHISLRKKEDINLEGMVERERKLNVVEIGKIVKNPDVYKRVLNKMGILRDSATR